MVDHAKSVQVTTDDGTVYTAKVIGTDRRPILHLIKVGWQKDFTFVRFSDTQPRVGDWVVAVGHPFGLAARLRRVSFPRVVATSARDYDDYVQIDAPINKGNSGGPAFDMSGNVIGVAPAIFTPSVARSASASTFPSIPRNSSSPS